MRLWSEAIKNLDCHQAGSFNPDNLGSGDAEHFRQDVEELLEQRFHRLVGVCGISACQDRLVIRGHHLRVRICLSSTKLSDTSLWLGWSWYSGLQSNDFAPFKKGKKAGFQWLGWVEKRSRRIGTEETETKACL